MSTDEIALIVVHLEEAGVPVELDDSLIAPNAKPLQAPSRSAEIIPFPDRAAAARMKKRAAPLQKAPPAQPSHPPSSSRKSGLPHWAVAIAGLAGFGPDGRASDRCFGV